MKLSVASLISLATLALSVPNPLPGGANVEVRDPAIMYNADSKKYFVFSTGSGIKIFTAGSSLKGPWTQHGAVLSNCTDQQCGGGTWAPDVHFVNGRYVLYYSISQVSSQNSSIGVATSPSMEAGTWNDLGRVISSKGGDAYNAIDGNLIQSNGLKFAFGSYNQGIFQLPLSDIHTLAADPPGTHLAGANGQPTEGGFTYKPQNSSYFFQFFSHGVTLFNPNQTDPIPAGQEYKVLVGRSKSVSGPFLDKAGHKLTEALKPAAGSLVLGSHDNVYAPGGQSLYRDPVSGRDVIVYHYVPRDALGGPARLGINFVDFSSGWPVLVD
ncbi:glycoside hydrolase family 43 protein [Daedaleopsis nitida]|nr:glycoside hydrolase family 43 protein [Daedaleopsis nitida]